MRRTRIIVALSSALLLACGDPEAGLCSEPEVLEGRLSGTVVVGETCSNWIVRNSVTVPEGATLSVLPGVTLTFADDTGLVIDGGTLDAAGTTEKPILFTGATPEAGAWSGVHVYRSNTVRNRLAHVTIEHAGGAKFSPASVAAALAVTGVSGVSSKVEVSDSTFRKSAGYGISLNAQAELSGFVRNRLVENALGAAEAHPASVHGFASGNTYGDGTIASAIFVQDGVLQDRQATFHDVGTPFVVGTIEAHAGGTLTLEPGAELHVRAGKQLRMVEGTLHAVGTAEKGIALRGAEQTPGFWVGVLIHASGGPNAMAHVTISDAGGAKDSWALAAANVALTDDAARLSITDSQLENGAGYGLYVDGNAALTGFEGNTLSGNALGAAYVQARNAHQLRGSNSLADNVKPYVWVDGSDAVNAEVSWAALDAPYFITKDFRVESHLTIEPGATLHFNADAALIVPAAGRLTAVGTAERPITFTRSPDVTSWKGLWLHSSTNENRIEHAIVSFGGGTASSWSSGNRAGLTVYQSKVNVSGTRFNNNTGYGLWVSTLSTATGCSAATFSDNSIGAMGGAPCI